MKLAHYETDGGINFIYCDGDMNAHEQLKIEQDNFALCIVPERNERGEYVKAWYSFEYAPRHEEPTPIFSGYAFVDVDESDEWNLYPVEIVNAVKDAIIAQVDFTCVFVMEYTIDFAQAWENEFYEVW